MPKRTLTCAAACAAALLSAPLFSEEMDKAAYEQTRTRIQAEYKADSQRCVEYKENMREVCRAEARGKRKVGLAEADAAYRNTESARVALRQARVEADLEVARQRCGELTGQRRSACVMEAQAAQAQNKAGRKNTG